MLARSRRESRNRRGLCATLPEPIAVGTAIAVDVQLVFADDLHSEALRIAARVVWCTLPEYLTMFLRYLDDSSPRAQPPATSVDDRLG